MILAPLSAFYGRLTGLRAGWYASGRLAAEPLPHPTISVGNLTLGGTGKTPFAAFLARRLRLEGWRPAILSRGYGRRSRGVVVVSAGAGPLATADDAGDEPAALARAEPGVIVVVGERRADAARRAAELGADLFVLDDGFQHLAVRRDVNLLLLDAADPFGGGRLPPAGRLREPVGAVARADAIVFTRVQRAAPERAAVETLGRLAPRVPVFHARIRAAGLADDSGAPLLPEAIAPRRLLSVCGIARPESFAATLAELGLSPEERLEFRDHQRYGPRQLARIRAAAERTGSSFVVTTEKDAVKLSGKSPLPLVTVRLAVDVEEPAFFALVASRLPRREAP
ncbi:MAG TPA: tetraacyldisaccharide 4'-kinase [Thermoanaerobaculia bacterium]|nr:tetraacyldisaccharide 4'-kinase [Thermoanaerobaculia bacterium]